MNTSASGIHEQRLAASRPLAGAAWVYPAAGVLIFLLMLIGFQQFYLRGLDAGGQQITPAIRPLVIVHGTLLTCWVALFCVQPLLVAVNQRRLHRQVGALGAALAAVIVLVSIPTAILSVRVHPDIVVWGLKGAHFLIQPLLSVVFFGAFVTVGVRFRRRPDVHRAMMLLATLAALPAITDRLIGLPNLTAVSLPERLVGPGVPPLALGLAVLAVRSVLLRRFDRPLAWGLLALMVLFLIDMHFGPTEMWGRIASAIVY